MTQRLSRLMLIAAISTFVASMVYTSGVQVVFSLAIAVNVLIIGTGVVRLYSLGLLVTPALFFFVLNLPHYSIGNIGVLAGLSDELIQLHWGAEDNYPLVAVLSSIGLLIYSETLKFLSRRDRSSPIAMLLEIRRRVSIIGVILSTGLAVGVVGYLTYKYPFTGGYFRDLGGQLDRFIAGTSYAFIFLAAGLSCCAATDARNRRLQVVGIAATVLLLMVIIGMRSRTMMLLYVLYVAALWLTIRRDDLRKVVVASVAAVVVVYAAGTLVKLASGTGEGTSSILENLTVLRESSIGTASSQLAFSLEFEAGRRVAGFEFPATLMLAQSNGASPLYGGGLLAALVGLLPSALRPEGDFSERVAIWEEARDYGMLLGDVSGVALSTGLAEIGIIGSMPIYAMLALWHVLLWRVACRSPVLFISYLAHIPSFMNMDLLWDSVIESLKTWLFMFAVVYLVRPVILPGLRSWTRAREAQDVYAPGLAEHRIAPRKS